MATDIAVIVNPGNFKAHKKDLEHMLAAFKLCMKSFTKFLTVTDNIGAAAAKNKALLQAVGGPDMVFLF